MRFPSEMTVITRGAALLALALGLLAAPEAHAADEAACCLRGTSTAANQLRQIGGEADEAFFTVKGAPPNLMFLVDTSGSMLELPIDPSDTATRNKGTGCSNVLYDAILTAGNFKQATGNYPQPDLGVAPCDGRADCWSGDSGFPKLFNQNNYFQYLLWDETTPYSYVYSNGSYNLQASDGYTAGNACAFTSDTAKCVACVTTKGYYLDPNSTANYRQVFSGKFLNFYSPKYIAARTVLKQVIWGSKQVRMGVSTFNGDTGAKLVSKLNPACDKSLDPADASWTNNRKSIVNEINNPSKVFFSGVTPLAEALLNVGQYFTSDGVYDSWFGAGWTNSDFKSDSVGSQTRSVCFGCQVSSVVIVTDGAPNGDNCMPQCLQAQDPTCTNCDQRDGNQSGYCPKLCGSGKSCRAAGTSACDTSAANMLDGVAKWLYEHDLQTVNPTNGSWSADGRQRLSTYTVGFGLDHPLLTNTAAVSGGKYYVANNAKSLKDALDDVVSDVNQRATTFGVSTISTLQTSEGGATLVPRFIPDTAGEEWRGLLFRFRLENELVNGCLPTVPPAVPDDKDLNGDGDCKDVLYVDLDGDVVEEEPVSGLFYKRNSSVIARPVWEAGDRLKALGPTARNLWTVLDNNVSGGDRKLDRNDAMVEFTAANALKLMPYMGISADVTNDPVCKALYAQMGQSSGLTTWGETCAKTIINYYRGLDAANPDINKRTLARPWLLNDVFHSSPVVVEPPIPNEACEFYPNQCIPSLFQNGKDDAASAKVDSDAYEDYVHSNSGPCGGVACEKRPQLVLVGSNGGFLHAFHGGAWDGNTDATKNRDFYTNRLKFNDGTGDEVWGFIPPDLLANLRQTMGKHGYYLDGTPMVRDIWVDDPDLSKGDGNKAAGEFRTVAVMGERSGGSHYFALDVTKSVSATYSSPAKPRPQFLWMWPQPCDPLAAKMGDAQSNYYPKPPPIGPVLLDASTTGNSNGFTFKYDEYDSSAKAFSQTSATAQERWVVMLNGGYDKTLLRGRGFATVDAYTGQTLWAPFFDPSGTTMEKRLEYPMAAGVAMTDIGKGELISGETVQDGFFDTANIGDLGGNLWVARFQAPGKLDSKGRVSNWFFGRAFQTDQADGNNMKDRRPISYITTNLLQADPYGWQRTYFGTGDRAGLLASGGEKCSLNNLIACVTMGCTVESTLSYLNTPTGTLSTSTTWDTYQLKTKTQDASSCTGTDCAPVCTSNTVRLYQKVSACPNTSGTSPTLERDATYGCTQTSGGLLNCGLAVTKNDKTEISYSATAAAALTKHHFNGIVAYGKTPTKPRLFKDAATAETFDSERISEATLKYMGNLGSTSTCDPATAGGLGWYIDYLSVDERTASAGGSSVSQTLTSACVLWNTLTPSTAGAVCGGSGNQEAHLVDADFITGCSKCSLGFNGDRYLVRTVLVPPPSPQPVLAVGNGKLIYGTITAEPGRDPQMTVSGQDLDPVQSIYQLELNQPEHLCRHTPGGAAYCGR